MRSLAYGLFLRSLVCLQLASFGIFAQTAYTVQTFAGTDFVGDGLPAKSALLQQPESMVVASDGSLYVSDAGDHRVRRIRTNGIIETVAGTGSPGFSGDDGPAVQARLNSPYGLALDRQGNLFIADLGNARVRKITKEGIISTVAGGNNGNSTNTVKLQQPRNLAADSAGNLFISDFGAHRVYRLNTQGFIQLVAGTGEAGFSGDGGPSHLAQLSYPAGLAIDLAGTLFIGDSENHRVRKIANGRIGTLQDPDGKDLAFNVPTGVAVDLSGSVYVADRTAVTTVVSKVVKPATMPVGGNDLAVDGSGRLYLTGDHTVKSWDGKIATIFAGSTLGMYAGDGRGKGEWRFDQTVAIARDRAGNLLIADAGNGRVRKISTSGELSSFAAGLRAPSGLAVDSADRVHVSESATGAIWRYQDNAKPVNLTGNAGARAFRLPNGLAFDAADNLYVADTGNNLIRKISPDGFSTILAGGGGLPGDGPALSVRLAKPYGLALDGKGLLWFSESESGLIRKLDLLKHTVATVAKTDFREPRGLRLDPDGNLLIADSILHRVFLLKPDGTWYPIAGTSDRDFRGDGGPAMNAGFAAPSDLLIERDGSMLVADSGNHRIRKLTPGGQVGDIVDPRPPGSKELRLLHAGTGKFGLVAPGQLVQIDLTGFSFTSAAEIKLELNGKVCAILGIVDKVATALVPEESVTGVAIVNLAVRNEWLGAGSVEVVEHAPAIFMSQGDMAAVINEDGTRSSLENPTGRGAIASVFLTGTGARMDPAVTVQVGLYGAEILYSGPAPGMAGLFQINFRLPAGFAPPGVQPLSIFVEGASIQPGVTIATR